MNPNQTCDAISAVMVAVAASPEKAQQAMPFTRACPYLATCSAVGNTMVSLFILPPSKRWWVEMPQENPDLIGMQKVVVYISEELLASSPWSRGEVEPVLEISPCRSNCQICPQYRNPCSGCPATIHYQP
jgi:hypothetical protein